MILVGEMNPYGHDPHFALYPYPPNSAGGRLCRILGMPKREYLKLRRYNLCVGRWGLVVAEQSAARIREAHPDEWIVLLGRKVAAAFFCSLLKPFEVDREGRFVSLPHPSGRCRAWNENGSVERARAAVAEIALSGAIRDPRVHPDRVRSLARQIQKRVT